MFKLRIRKKVSTILYTASDLFRIPFALLVAAVVWTALGSGERPGVLMIITALVGAVGMLYVETWTFDREKRTAVSVNGVWPFLVRRTYTFDSIESLSVRHYSHQSNETGEIQAGRGRTMIAFSLCLKSGKQVPVELMTAWARIGQTARDAAVIADFCGLDFNVDPPVQDRLDRKTGYRGTR